MWVHTHRHYSIYAVYVCICCTRRYIIFSKCALIRINHVVVIFIYYAEITPPNIIYCIPRARYIRGIHGSCASSDICAHSKRIIVITIYIIYTQYVYLDASIRTTRSFILKDLYRTFPSLVHSKNDWVIAVKILLGYLLQDSIIISTYYRKFRVKIEYCSYIIQK